MRTVSKNETGEYELNADYSINTVHLTEVEAEHTHRFIELVYTLGGRGIHRIDGKEYHVRGGDVLIVNFHCRHTVIPVENLRYVDIMLKPEYVNDTLRGTEDLFLLLRLREFSALSSGVIKENLLLHFEGEERKRLEGLLEWTRDEQTRRAPAGELIIYSALSMLLCTVFRKMTEHQGVTASLNDRLLEYVRRNCGSRLAIGEIAAGCGYTPEHFSRLFKKYTGISPTAYLTECRIDRARELLATTDLPIETVMLECGFSDRTAFFKKFRTAVGTTPLRFRKDQN